MKFSLNSQRLRVLLLASWLVMYGHTPAQTQVRPPPGSTAEVGNTNLVMARPLYAIDRSGGGLALPDGSVVKTVWPAALAVTTITDNPKWANQPVMPRCEPAVYSLARITPDGKELWAKSYIFKGKVMEVCYAQYLGFDVRSALSEVETPGFYRLPFNGRFFVGEPTDPGKFEVDAATGDVFGAVPKNLRVIDAYALRALKDRIDKEIEEERPPPSTKKGRMNEQVHKTQLFKRLEKTLFPNIPRRADGTPNQRP